MKLALLAVGKLKDSWAKEGCAEYAKRISVRLPFAEIEVRDDAELVRRIPERFELWVLDSRGKQLTSEELAAQLKLRMNQSAHGMAFVIGGADGVPPALVKQADYLWSLGKGTLPHRLARLVVTEQLYRALSIVRGEPYHHA